MRTAHESQLKSLAAPDPLEPDLRRFSILFDGCIGEEGDIVRSPTLSMMLERARMKLVALFDVDNLSTIEAAWLRHIAIMTLHYYNHHKELEARGEVTRFTLKTAPFNEIAMVWVMELYRPDLFSCGELHHWRESGTISEAFKRDLRLQRDLAHKL